MVLSIYEVRKMNLWGSHMSYRLQIAMFSLENIVESDICVKT